jgi:hypothetical protein
MTASPDHPRLSPTRQTARRYGVSLKTIERWRKSPQLGFPEPVHINGHNYDRIDALDEFDRACARKAASVGAKRSRDRRFVR